MKFRIQNRKGNCHNLLLFPVCILITGAPAYPDEEKVKTVPLSVLCLGWENWLRPGFSLSSSPIKTSGPPGLDQDPEPTVRSSVSLWPGKLRSKLGCLGWDRKVEWWVALFLFTWEASHFLWCWKDQTFSYHRKVGSQLLVEQVVVIALCLHDQAGLQGLLWPQKTCSTNFFVFSQEESHLATEIWKNNLKHFTVTNTQKSTQSLMSDLTANAPVELPPTWRMKHHNSRHLLTGRSLKLCACQHLATSKTSFRNKIFNDWIMWINHNLIKTPYCWFRFSFFAPINVAVKNTFECRSLCLISAM